MAWVIIPVGAQGPAGPAGGVLPAPTLTIKKGSGAGNYTTVPPTSNYQDVDPVALAFSPLIPTGQKMLILLTCTGNTGNTGTLGIFDGAVLLREKVITEPQNTGIMVQAEIDGDNAVHVIKGRFHDITPSVFTIRNSVLAEGPEMSFLMLAAN